jgi:hypothetical protein
MAQAPAGLKPGGVFLTPRVELTARCFSVFPAITVGIKVHIIDAAGVSLVTVCMAKSRIVHAGSDETADMVMALFGAVGSLKTIPFFLRCFALGDALLDICCTVVPRAGS